MCLCRLAAHVLANCSVRWPWRFGLASRLDKGRSCRYALLSDTTPLRRRYDWKEKRKPGSGHWSRRWGSRESEAVGEMASPLRSFQVVLSCC